MGVREKMKGLTDTFYYTLVSCLPFFHDDKLSDDEKNVFVCKMVWAMNFFILGPEILNNINDYK